MSGSEGEDGTAVLCTDNHGDLNRRREEQGRCAPCSLLVTQPRCLFTFLTKYKMSTV